MAPVMVPERGRAHSRAAKTCLILLCKSTMEHLKTIYSTVLLIQTSGDLPNLF